MTGGGKLGSLCVCAWSRSLLSQIREGGGGGELGNGPRAQKAQRLHFTHDVNTIANQIECTCCHLCKQKIDEDRD